MKKSCILIISALLVQPIISKELVLQDFSKATFSKTNWVGWPSGYPRNLKTPLDYSNGTLHIRMEVKKAPSDPPDYYTFCFIFANLDKHHKWGTGDQPGGGIKNTGVYYYSGEVQKLWKEKGGRGYSPDWTKGISQTVLVTKKCRGSGECDGGATYGGHFTAVLVAKGHTFSGWKTYGFDGATAVNKPLEIYQLQKAGSQRDHILSLAIGSPAGNAPVYNLLGRAHKMSCLSQSAFQISAIAKFK